MLQRLEKQLFSSILVGDESLLIGCGDLLLEQGCSISGVITENLEIQDWATENGIPVFTLESDIADKLSNIPFDWLFSIANLQIIPDKVLCLASKGAINFHDGPLPRYAGVNAPVWALMNREKDYGVTWHMMEGGIDEGDIVEQTQFEIAPGETAHSLNSKCYAAALDGFSAVVSQLMSGVLVRRSQNFGDRKYFARDARPSAAGRLDFSREAPDLVALVCALNHGDYWNPLCCPKIETGEGVFLIRSAELAKEGDTARPGTILEVDASGLVVVTQSGAIRLGQITDQVGQPVDFQATFTIGQCLVDLDPVESQALTDATSRSAKYDTHWRKRLQTMRPLNLPVIASAETAELARRSIRLPAELKDERLLAAIAIWAANSGGARTTDIAYRARATADATKTAPAYLSEWVPLRLGRNQDDRPAITFAEAVDDIAIQLTSIEKAPTFSLDLIARDPQITTFRTPAVGVSETVSAMIEGTCLSVVLPTEGKDATIICDMKQIDPAYLELLIDRLELLAATVALAGTDDLPIDQLSVLPKAERDLVVDGWNQTATFYDKALTLHTAFEDQVARTPDEIALVVERSELSFDSLNARANQVAHVLRNMGVGPGMPVGLCVRRSPYLLVAALGILKAGGAYVPLDPDYPADRLAHYLEDSAASVVVTQASLADALPLSHAARLIIDEDPRIDPAPATNIDSGVTSGDLAYLIYTSGSTGKPKGVMVAHRNVANFFAGMDDRIDVESRGVWLAVTSLSFDISILELFYTLARGYKVVLAGDLDRAMVSNGPIRISERKIDFSLFYWGNDDGAGPKKYELLLEGAKFADTHGFCAVWTPERHFHAFGGPYPNPSVTGAAVAAVTKNIGVRAGSCVAPLHHPARIAEDWAVIDNLTNGRAGLAIASGWQPDDFVLRPENTPPNNKAAMFDAIDKLRQLWRGEPVEFPTQSGEPFAVVTQPRPVSKDLPIWVTTAGNPETWKEAGAIGANVLTHLLGQSIAEVAEKIKIYHSALRDAGYAPADHTVTLMLHTFVGDDRDQVREIVREPMKDYLRSAAGLIKQYAWAFPAFKKPKGISNPFQIDLSALNEDEMEAILDFAFHRYFDDAGLFGTRQDCVDRVEALKRIGVDEVACLIDYGIATQKVMDGLAPLAEVLQLANAETTLDDDDFSIAAQILRHGVTHLQCTPSMARMIVMNDEARLALGRINHLMIGGEALPGALAKDLRAATDAKILNLYGPTETTIWSTTQAVENFDDNVPIGRPISNTRVYVLDEAQQLCPVGVAGELYIAGDGVTRGYWKREALTAERFLADPFGPSTADAMYRTGDLVRWRADGCLEFLGRTDHQVKVRGHRLELGEIEAALTNLPGIQAAIVVPRYESHGDVRLHAYVISENIVSQDRLRNALAARLPNHMVPSHITNIDAFPLTPNKKVDRAALEKLPITSSLPAVTAVSLPGSDSEKIIAGVWSRILGVSEVASNANFFALGGHSLLAVQAHRELRDELGAVALSITDIFAHPTLSDLAKYIDKKNASGSEEPNKRPNSSAPLHTDRASAMSRRRAMRSQREMEHR